MSKTLACLSVVAASLTAALIGPTAHADQYQTRGGSAYLDARYFSNDDCLYIHLNAVGDESRYIDGIRASNLITVAIFLLDFCTPAFYDCHEIFHGSFVPPNNKLISATTTITEQTLSCEGSPTISLKAIWTGIGDISRTQWYDHTRGTSYIILSKQVGSSRDAELAIDLEINGVPAGSPTESNGYISLINSGQVDISHHP